MIKTVCPICFNDKAFLIEKSPNGKTKCTKCSYENYHSFFSINMKQNKAKNPNSNNNGGSTDYYKLPTNAKDLQDLIESKEMNFSQGNIFKAIYRANENHHSTYERDLNKIIWFANRELERIGNIRADLEIIGH